MSKKIFEKDLWKVPTNVADIKSLTLIIDNAYLLILKPIGLYVAYSYRYRIFINRLILFRTFENHDDSMVKADHGLSEEVKREVDSLFALKVKPKQSLAKLREKGHQNK